MNWNLKNGCVTLHESDMYYVSFGHGKRNLIVLPGLSDGLATVYGKAVFLAKPYTMYFDDFTVYMFSRRNDLPIGHTIEQMAQDQTEALEKLGIEKTAVLGVSQGGMIAQAMALQDPQRIESLVLAVTAPCRNELIDERLNTWIACARAGDHKQLMIDTAEHSYSSAYLAKYRKLYPFLGAIGKPKTYDRFLANAEAILKYDRLDSISSIHCPTLIIGGEQDQIVGPNASYDMHERISGSELFMYPEQGHALYEEVPSFYGQVFHFVKTANEN